MRYTTMILLGCVFMWMLSKSIGVLAASEEMYGVQNRLQHKSAEVKQKIPGWVMNGGNIRQIKAMGSVVEEHMNAGKPALAEQQLDRMLAILNEAPKQASAPPNGSADNTSFEELIIHGEKAVMGYYDPSLEYATDGIGWMAYSAVKLPPGKGPEYRTVNTHIARSDDHGQSWHFVTAVNHAEYTTLQTSDGEVSGAWVHETPTLVYDAGDAGREWKLFWHRYFSKKPVSESEDRMFRYSWFGYRTAPSPKGPWSDEVALMSTGMLPSPYSARVNISDLHSDLEDYMVLTEPGSIVVDGIIYLSVQAAKKRLFGRVTHDIILLASDDHGKSWRYIDTLLFAENAKPYDADFYTGTSLAQDKDRLFLLVTPSAMGRGKGEEHLGTVIFEITDITNGTLKHDANGQATPIKYIPNQLEKAGQSDYDASNIRGGIIFPQMSLKNAPRIFRLFNTQQTIVAP